ncbi:MAG: hypothetical protein LC660_08660 [Desulfobacteraceae bacterium]|nr:hypothetical protein [Desulfobacteraceae bacterium]
MKQKDKVRLVTMVSDEQRREIKSFAGAEGITITEAMLTGFSLLKNGADGLIEALVKEHDVDPKLKAWADKVLKGVDDAN